MTNKVLMAGSAKVNITPSPDYFPVFNKPNGIGGGSDSIFSCAHSDIYVRGLLIDNGIERVFILSLDWGMIDSLYDNGEVFSKIISETADVPMKNIMATVTHNHNCLDLNMAKMAMNPDPNSPMRLKPSPVTDDLIEKAKRYQTEVEEAVRELAILAVKHMKPARIGFGKGVCYANVNRHCYSETGMPSIAGFEPDRPSDRELIVLKVDDTEGNNIAVIYNYAAHASLLANNKPDGEHTELSGDWPGEVSRKLEEYLGEGSVALHLPGAGGDQNCIMIARVYKVLPNGKGTMYDFGPVGYTVLEFMADMIFRDTVKVMNSIKDYKEYTRVWAGKSTCPWQEEFAKFDGGKFSERHKRDSEFQFTLIMLGDIALASTNGEIYTKIGMRFKEDSPYRKTMFITHGGRMLGYIKDDSGHGAAENAIRDHLYGLMEQYSNEV